MIETQANLVAFSNFTEQSKTATQRPPLGVQVVDQTLVIRFDLNAGICCGVVFTATQVLPVRFKFFGRWQEICPCITLYFAGLFHNEVVRNSLPVFSSNVDHTPPAIQVKNVVIDATRALGLGLSSNVQIDASQPIITTVNGLGSLASSTEVKSSLPISNLVQDKILNDADRRYIDVALKDPASSGRVFSFNAPD